MSTKMLLWICGGIFALAIATTIALYPRCEKPSDMMVRIAMIQCVIETMQDHSVLTKDQVCEMLGRQPNCQVSESDLPAIDLYVRNLIGDCTKKKMANENMCTDTVDQVMKETE